MSDWRRNNSQSVFECPIFKVRRDQYSSAKRGCDHEFFIIEPANWINIIAITAAGEVVMVKQYRFGRESYTLEIPGGVIDEGESAEAAARRELLEETGYQAENWQWLGSSDPDSAIMNNRCDTFLAWPAVLNDEQNLDNLEEIEVQIMPLSQVPEMIATGKISHALVIAAFYYHDLYQRKEK